jgi:hypothetical protein
LCVPALVFKFAAPENGHLASVVIMLSFNYE